LWSRTCSGRVFQSFLRRFPFFDRVSPRDFLPLRRSQIPCLPWATRRTSSRGASLISTLVLVFVPKAVLFLEFVSTKPILVYSTPGCLVAFPPTQMTTQGACRTSFLIHFRCGSLPFVFVSCSLFRQLFFLFFALPSACS